MAKANRIRKRAVAIQNIRDVTRTIEMVANVRFQQTHRAATRARPYTEHLAYLVEDIVARARPEDMAHPLLHEVPNLKHDVLLVVAGNRGLCGGHHSAILRTATGRLKQLDEAGYRIDLHVIGRKAVEFFRARSIEIARTYPAFHEIPDYPQVQQLGDAIIDAYLAGRISGLEVAYTQFVSAGEQRTVIAPVLPIAELGSTRRPEGQAEAMSYELHPSAGQLLAELLPAMVKLRLYQYCLESAVSEQIARIGAMRAASDNAADMLKELTTRYNRLRQAAITTELTEIIGGRAGAA